MNEAKREALEQEIRSRLERGDVDGAADVALRGYGREISNFLIALHRRDEDSAAEAFSLFSVGFWKSLPRFAGDCTFRTWAYAIARRCSLRVRRDEGRRDARHERLPEGSALSRLVAEIQRETATSVRAERRSRLVELREALPEEEQTILMLHVDQGLRWNDLAQVLRDEDAPPLEGKALERESQRLRKRFQTIKEKLVKAARREGLDGPRPDGP
jgi:RNA polymerase sigma-70 factor (ECF subfamily)